jgi:ribosomal protein L7Ae-like RNA K-turn-binding protein
MANATLTASFVETLTELSGPLLTVYVNTQPSDASTQRLASESLVWLKQQAKEIEKLVPEKEQKRYRKQVERVEKFLTGRVPQEKAVYILASAATWKVVPLPTQIENEMHWGAPAITQLLWMLNENKAHCVVVLDRKGARFLRYWAGEVTKIAERKFGIDVSQWKEKDLGTVTQEGVKKTRGSQRDVYEHRVDAQYRRMCRETAAQARKLCEKEKIEAIFVVGSDRLTRPIEAEFPKQSRERVVRIREDFGGLTLPELQKRLTPRIAAWERENESALVEHLLADERKTVMGVDETLTQLQKGKMRTVVLARPVHGDLHECIECGWMDRSGDPVCSVCGRERRAVELREMLPDLARRENTGIEVVSGAAAEQLGKAGGMGGWLRGRTQTQLR